MQNCWQKMAAMAAAWAFLFPAGEAAGRDWYRYENDHFIAYSNAPEARTRLLLDELERFRAVFLLVGNVSIPEDAPRTTLILVRNRSEFLQFHERNVAGFAMRGGDGPTLMVMPATGDRDWAMAVIRHEFAHALLGYKTLPYPFWYEEGFAEIMSAVSFPDRGRAFTIGGVLQRQLDGGPRYDWNDLIADDFNLHAIRNPVVGSSAYWQAWLLAHWATFGDEGRNAPRLQQYFNLMRAGTPSLEAFVQSFGATPAELWAGPLRQYAGRIPVYTFNFDTNTLDITFDQTAAQPAEYEPILEFLRLRQRARSARVIRDPLPRLDGTWGVIPRAWYEAASADHCSSPMTFSVDADAQVLSRAWRSGTGESRSDSFRIEVPDRETLLLHRESSEGGGSREPSRVQMPEQDLICLRDADEGSCRSIYQRCEG